MPIIIDIEGRADLNKPDRNNSPFRYGYQITLDEDETFAIFVSVGELYKNQQYKGFPTIEKAWDKLMRLMIANEEPVPKFSFQLNGEN